jgi:hypothetical protein
MKRPTCLELMQGIPPIHSRLVFHVPLAPWNDTKDGTDLFDPRPRSVGSDREGRADQLTSSTAHQCRGGSTKERVDSTDVDVLIEGRQVGVPL